MPDGSLYIEAEGQEKDLEKFFKWCHDGPAFAKVNKVEVSKGSIKKFTDFNI